MYTYTMTFVYEGELGLPKKILKHKNELSFFVLNKLSNHELILADFNWAGNYDKENTLSYLGDPYRCGAVIEMRLQLDITIIQSREAIYDRCINALKQHELCVQHSQQLINPDLDKPQNIISFDMKNNAAA